MKSNLQIVAIVLLLLSAIQLRADILAGPITNPENGHDYYLLTPNTWTASEAEAEALGGTLAIVRSPAEHDWIYSRFGSDGATHRNLWIGLHRKVLGGDFFWVNDAPVAYTNWFSGEPSNRGGNETCVEMWGETSAPGTWNDAPEAILSYGVVEVSDKIPLTDAQRALVGDWYVSGNISRLCHISEAKDALFAINDLNNASHLVPGRKGFLFAVPWQLHAEIVGDKILWSNGTWWSRTPMDFSVRNAPKGGE